MREDIDQVRKKQDDKTVSLNEKQVLKELEEQQAREAARDGVLASAPGASLEDRVKAALRTLRRE